MSVDPRGFVQQLVEDGLLQPQAVRDVLAAAEGSGSRIDTILLDLGLVSEPVVLRALGHFLNARTANGTDLAMVRPELARLISPRVAARFGVLPVRQEGKNLMVATLDPGDLLVEDELAMMTGCMVTSLAALEVRLFQALHRLYGITTRPQVMAVARRLDAEPRDRPDAPSGPPRDSTHVQTAPQHDKSEPPTPPPPPPPDPTPARVHPTELEISAEELALFPSLRLEEETGDSTPEPAPVTASPTHAAVTPTSAEFNGPPIVVPSGPAVEIPRNAGPEDRLAAAAVALQGAEMRDDIADTVLEFCAPYLARRMLAVVRGDAVVGWRGEGDDVDESAIRAISIPLSEPSVFLGLTQGQSFWLGPVPPMPHNLSVSLALGGDPPPECLILPVVLRSKTVCFLYGDNLSEPVRSAPIGHLRRLVQMAGLAFQVYLLKSKMRRV